MAYKILSGSSVICDSTSPGGAVIAAKLSLEVNKVWSFEFELPPDHHSYNSITEHSTEISVSLDGADPIFTGEVYKITTDFYGRKRVYCEDQLGYFNNALVAPHRYSSMNVSDIITAMVAEYNAQCSDRQFSVGTVQTTHTTRNLAFSTNYDSVLTVLQNNVIKKCGGYLYAYYSGGIRYLGYRETPSSSGTTQTIRIGANLLDFVREVDASKLCSVLIPLGEKSATQNVEGVEQRITIYTDNRPTDRIESASLISAIGRVVKTRIWDSVSDPDSLYAIGVDYLTNQLADVTIEATAFDLNLADENIQRINLYDSIRVISEPHGLDAYFPVMELELNLNSPASDKITLGETELPSISTMSADATAAIAAAPDVTSVQTTAAARAAQVLASATNGYIYFHYDANDVLDEIYIKDLTDPDHKWWRWNVNGLGYTNDGGTTYEIAMTMDGALVSNLGYIGGWEITTSGLSRTVADENDPTKVYRVTMYPPDASDPGASKVFGFEISEDSGNTFSDSFYITGGGSIYMYADNLNASFNLIGSGQGSYSAQITPSMLTMGNSTGYGRLYPGNIDGGLGSGTWTFGINATSGLRFSKNGVQTALYSAEGWTDVSVADGFANGGTTVWHCLTNNATMMCYCRRTFYNVSVDYAWGNIYNGTGAGGTGCNFKTVGYPTTFVSEPLVMAQVESLNGGKDGWLTTNEAWTQSNKLNYAPAYDLARATAATIDEITLNYFVIGEVTPS